jgi:hypothetical protein
LIRLLNRLAAFVPLAVHIALAAATVRDLPTHLGRTVDRPGMDTKLCLAAWVVLTLACNTAFTFLDLRMPKFKDAALRLTGRSRRPLTREARNDLVSRLQAVAETALLCLNIFFLAVYQAVYQANTPYPILQFPMIVLFVGFMLVPLLLLVFYIALTVHRTAERSPESPSEQARGQHDETT